MRILVGKTFGIGNAVMAIPMIKALIGLNHEVDVLVGTLPDDFGAYEVLRYLACSGGVRGVWQNNAPMKPLARREYDVAVMSIPFDGRWQEGRDFLAHTVCDCRTRPDPSTTGLISWKRHEMEYQMDFARTLGWATAPPPTNFLRDPPVRLARTVYFGMGYKKDQLGFWKIKHWGFENFVELARMILQDHPENKIVTTGSPVDFQLDIAPVMRAIGQRVGHQRFIYHGSRLDDSFRMVSSSKFYVGNDTGMMHVAAAEGVTTLGLFFMEGSVIKNNPIGPDAHWIESLDRSLSPKKVFEELKELGL